MKIQILAPFFALTFLTGQAQAAVPDFKLEAYREGEKGPLVGVVVKAPEKHHFNVKAPMSAKTVGSSIPLSPILAANHEIRFEVANSLITRQDSIEVAAYLCDDAKTYCVKKSGSVALASAASTRPAGGPARAKVAAIQIPVTPQVKKKISKDAHGFWNDVGTAQKYARQLNRPLLIDFYGIWCPPCNLYNETVFPTALFKKLARSFVLVKVDVDHPESWSIKSKFKIGGYPTLVFAKPNLDEIDRVVGYLPRDEFAARMKEAYANRDKTFEERVVLDKAKYLDGIQSLIDLRYEQKDFKEALRYVQEGLLLKPEDPFFKIMKITIIAKDEPKSLRQADNTAFLKSIWENRSQASAAVLLRFQDLINSHADILSAEQVLWAADAVDHLKTRVDEKTLHLEGQEMSLADLDALRVDIFENAKKEDRAKQAVKDTIASYQRLMKLFDGEKSRGFNLELAYFLGKDGRIPEATAIYEGFIKQYPKEFTYYYAAARHYQEIAKNLKRARECAELALKYSYGDNQLRAMARLLAVRAAQGEAKEGVEQAKLILGKIPSYDGLSVRTGRYVSALEKAIEKANSEAKE